MRRAIQSWAVVGSFLGAVMLLGEGASGCFFRVLEDQEAQGVGGNGPANLSGGSTTTITTAATGSGGSSTGSSSGGAGGDLDSMIIQEQEGPAQNIGLFEAGERGTRITIHGTFTDSGDVDTFSFNIADNYVLQFETTDPTPLDANDAPCDSLSTSLTLSKKNDNGTSSDYFVDPIEQKSNGINSCVYMSYYLSRQNSYDLKIQVSSADAQFVDRAYEIIVNIVPVNQDLDLENHDTSDSATLLTGWDETGEGTVALTGASSLSKPDYYKLSTTDKAVRVEVIEGTLDSSHRCESESESEVSFPFEIQLYNSEMNDLDVDPEGKGRGHCPMIDGLDIYDKSLNNNIAKALPSDAYIIVTPRKNVPKSIPIPYTLLVTVRSPTKQDGM